MIPEINVYPLEIKRLSDKGLEVAWNTGERMEIDSYKLRINCPCATCREKMGDTSHSTPLTGSRRKAFNVIESSIEDETRLLQVWAVGQYAIGIAWADGHDTGIFSYSLLYRIGQEATGRRVDSR
jgi:DUF971 family protein